MFFNFYTFKPNVLKFEKKRNIPMFFDDFKPCKLINLVYSLVICKV